MIFTERSAGYHPADDDDDVEDDEGNPEDRLRLVDEMGDPVFQLFADSIWIVIEADWN
jgi:hypothetical protein